jgi:hypothetical protein
MFEQRKGAAFCAARQGAQGIIIEGQQGVSDPG